MECLSLRLKTREREREKEKETQKKNLLLLPQIFDVKNKIKEKIKK